MRMESVGGEAKRIVCPESCQDFTDDASMHFGDTIVAPLVTIGEVFVVETEKIGVWIRTTGVRVFTDAYLLP